MRIALFGGTFDPPHNGHLAVARAAAAQFQLSTVFLTPAGRQPLKHHEAGACYADRLTMAALACAAAGPGFAVSNLDAPREDGTPNYTVTTLTLLHELFPQAELFALVGADSFHTLARWRQPARLLELAQWIVVSRPGFALAAPAGMTLTPAQQTRIHVIDSVHEDVSATELRTRLEAGDPCEDLLPAQVARYIQAQGLYRPAAPGRQEAP